MTPGLEAALQVLRKSVMKGAEDHIARRWKRDGPIISDYLAGARVAAIARDRSISKAEIYAVLLRYRVPRRPDGLAVNAVASRMHRHKDMLKRLQECDCKGGGCKLLADRIERMRRGDT